MASPAVTEAVSGGLGSLIALAATYPLKTLYTLQAIRMEEGAKGRRLSAAERAELARSPAKLVAALLPSLGTLYSGFKPAAVETAASNAIYFYFYSLLRATAVSAQRRRRGLPSVGAGSSAVRSEDIGVPASLLVAALAGAINMLFTTPAQVVATQMQAAASLKRQREAKGVPTDDIRSDTWGVVRHVYSTDGLAGFWKGLAPSLILVVNPAVQYMAFEWMTQQHRAWKARKASRLGGGLPGKTKLSAGEVFLIGAGAKIAATIVTYPMIVIKSRLQATSSHTAAELQYAGTWDAVCRIGRDEGLAGYFKGMQAKILQTALNAALMLSIKEQVHGSAAAAVRAAEGLLVSVQQQPAGSTRVPVHLVTRAV